MKFYLALWFAKIINVIINIVDKSRGSNFSGQKAMKIDPQMVAHFKGIDYSKVLFITGTNGKSTTNNLVNHIFRTNGRKVVSNLEGANLIYGVATALSKASSLTGRIKADYIIFETDERYLPLIYKLSLIHICICGHGGHAGNHHPGSGCLCCAVHGDGDDLRQYFRGAETGELPSDEGGKPGLYHQRSETT